ncbi:hypothetical protein AUEXF2481DRAFT_88074 [Aureobasidium subglaciale EXF-2481]|uniref:PA14 domain-containing protein n=1 Tax=Aureobasidium subglaciale (strain EXF-2481) TaxID=1043005 RepID=A0A074YDM0_AURSE|nr:uncharacterized protein AUEXF2481DRAFT_88074 [Aureobasidium subglaciale EXF-2481]KAI5211067.1 hypothetical protein E4T38_01539 [Aureobasidium subglaciale]KAI5219064.1 hypothetical protein E4T40_06609 [Aureobasidium subglaciale]KAI5233202.1 hypothetical protein E4T41_01537 [Aureobasidium subglaciale]KAI5260007.1 hypothetical protein E4T46_06409 [Aureobasidium subglaciale]KEQ95918.1 hypothetical protein AUEXF2481DRAFT_88074 [Aureobasidium subglaciale EXF-2481]
MAIKAAYFTLVTASISSLVSAIPLEERTLNLCPAVDLVVGLLRAYPSASPFCSSILQIKTSTVTSTVQFTSPVTTIIPTTTTTIFVAASPVVEYDISSTTITTCIPSAAKRDLAKRRITSIPVSGTSSTSIPASISIAGTCNGCPNILKNIACSAISSACRCLGVPTPTSTLYVSTTYVPVVTSYSGVAATQTTTETTTIPTTSTSTVLSCPTPSICGNQGIQYAYYANEPWGNDIVNGLDPAYYWSYTPDYSGTTTEVGGINEGDESSITLYGSDKSVPSTFFVLNHRGYIFAQVAGVYTFTTSQADDITYLYLGDAAYKGYTRSNYNAKAVCCDAPANSASGTYTLESGQYLPFRLVFGQQGGPVVFSFSVTAPDGTVILDANTHDSKFIVQYSCDGTTAPAFPAWGQETPET